MNCANHPQNPVAAYCRTCGKPLCSSCSRQVMGVIYCENCLAERVSGSAPPPSASPYQAPYRSPVQPVTGPNPVLAGILAGFFPFGVGALYCEQYAKFLAYLSVFVLLIEGASHSTSDATGTIFGLGIAAFYFYQLIDAIKSAKTFQSSQPAPEPAVAAYCRGCGKPLCSSCTRQVMGVIYCENCLHERASGSTPPPSPLPSQAAYRAPVQSVTGPNPVLAGILAGLLPFGVGAVYCGQYARFLAHLIVFALLIVGTSHFTSDAMGTIFGLAVAAFYFYQLIDAIKSAKAIRVGQPAPDPFGLGSIFIKPNNNQNANLCFSCGKDFSPATASPLQPISKARPQYSNVVLQLLGGLFFLAAAVVDCFQLELLNTHGTVLIRPLLMMGVALWLLVVAKRSWKTITADVVSEGGVKRSQKRMLETAIILGVLFLSCASLLGWLVGKTRLQLRTLDADLTEYAELGDDMTRVRSNNAGKTIENFIAMYDAIEKDTNALQRNTTRLIKELTEYDIQFPEYHTQTQKSLHNVTVTQRRTFLLQKQIAVAKELKSVDPSGQGALWSEKMMPLLREEERLDSQ